MYKISEPELIDKGGSSCLKCGQALPAIKYKDSGEIKNLPCRICNYDDFLKDFRTIFDKVVQEKE